MKIVKILSAFAAVCALVIGCAKEGPTVLKEIQVSSSYVGIPTNGGSKTITVTATDSWSINEIPQWLTISPASGSAGETTVTFTAGKALSNNENTVKIVCAGKSQSIIVKQLAEKVEPKVLTVSEAIAICNKLTDQEIAPGTYRVKGVVCSIVELSESYGNVTFFISDDGKNADGKRFEVYRALWLNGAKFKAGDSLEIGDEVIIEGQIMNYKGTPETKEGQAFVYQINKSLIKCDSLVFEGAKLAALPIEGGEFEAALTCKGNGVSVVVPDDAKSWLSVTGVKTVGEKATVSFLAAQNDAGDRSTTLTFSTTDGKKDYTAQATLSQKGAILEVSVAEFNAAEVGSTVYRLGGFVTKLDDASKGRFHFKDFSGETYAYNVTNMADFSSLKEGDIVIITGTRGQYNTTIELMNGVIEEVKTVTPVTAAEASTLADDDKNDPQNYVLISGTVTDGSTVSGHKFDLVNYGNFDLVDESGSIYVYGVTTGWNGTKGNGAFATLGVEEGDVITIVAYKTSYNGMNQLVGMYVSHEAGETPDPPVVEVTEYSIDLAYTGEGKFYNDGVATINGEADQKVLKIGTSSATGSVTFTVPAGSKKVTAYAIAWKGQATTLEFKVGDTVVGTQEIAANDGATGNSPYTITVTASDKYTIDLGGALEADTSVTVSTAADANPRAIFFGVKAVK